VRLIATAAAIEAVAGIALAIDPSFFSWLIFGAALPAVGSAVARVGGVGLLALAVACWPLRGVATPTATRGLLVYNVLAAIFFLYVGITHQFVGVLLWPAAALHATFSVLLARLVLSNP
jgi:hypothetical protein